MKLDFLDKALWKPIGKGLSEVDRFVDREMPFDSGWGFPAAAAAAYYAYPYVASSLGGASGASGAGSMTAGNSMLANYGLDAGTGFTASNGASFALPSSAFTPEYLNMIAAQNGVDLGDPTLFQRFMGNTEQGLYNPNQMSGSKLLSQLLKSRSKQSQPMQQQQQQQIAQQPTQQTFSQQSLAPYEDLNEPFYDPNLTQQERSRKLLAQQLRLLKPRMGEKPQFNNLDIQSLLSNLKV